MKLTEGIVRLTGLKVSRPKLPLLFRLPISVWELDWDIPSKNGLFEERWENPQHATLQSSKRPVCVYSRAELKIAIKKD